MTSLGETYEKLMNRSPVRLVVTPMVLGYWLWRVGFEKKFKTPRNIRYLNPMYFLCFFV